MVHAALSSSALIGSGIDTVLEAAVAAGARGVEWTDDGFVEPGDAAAAQEAMYATLRAGLCTVSYATLYRACLHDRTAFRQALSTARGLNSPILRLWSAPRGDSPEADGEAFVAAARSLGDEAGEAGVTLCFGLSAGSVLGSCRSAAVMLAETDHPFVKLAWSPALGARFDDSMEAIASVAGRMALVVVRSEDLGGTGRDLSEEWLQYLDSFEEQGDSHDMARHVVVRSLSDPSRLAEDIRSIDGWSLALRRYHKRRVY